MGKVVYLHTEIVNNQNTFEFKFESCQVTSKTIIINAIEENQELSLPLSLFKNKESALRLIVKYLIDEKKLTFTKTAAILNRNVQAVWCTYKAVKSKKINYSEDYIIPVSIFGDRKLSILESLVNYLAEYYSYSQIGNLISKDPRTIWTVKMRAQKKLVNARK